MQTSNGEHAPVQSEDATPHGSPDSPQSDLPDRLDEVVRDSLRPVASALGILYVVFAIGYLFFFPGLVMILVVLGTAAAFFLLAFTLRRWPCPRGWAHPIGAGIAALVLLSCLLRLSLTAQAQHTTSISLLLIGVGCFFLSTRWLVLVLAGSLGAWGVVAWIVSGGSAGLSSWLHFAFLLLGATVLSGLIHTVRVRQHRSESLAIERLEQAQKNLYERTSQLQETTKTLGEVVRNLEWSENQLRKLHMAVKQSPSAIIITDAKGGIEYVNPKFTSLTGYSSEEVLGKNPRILKSGDMPPEKYEELWETLASGREWRGEFRNKTKDGGFYWASASISPIRGPQGVITHFIAIQEDITRRKRAEEALREAKEAAEAANKAKSDFLAKMSHELRTPLNSIIGFSNVLLKNKKGNLSEQDINYLQRVLDNGKHLLELINDILDLSKVEAGRMELDTAPVDLDLLIRQTAAQFEERIRDRDVVLLTEIPPSMAPIQTDEQKLKQVIINLASNALKFTEKGSVTIRVSMDPETHRPARIDVVDTGIGIPKEKQDEIFDAFRQADSSTTREYGGTGLGLSISRSLCRLMGYSLELTSEIGKGSTFSVLMGYDKESLS